VRLPFPVGSPGRPGKGQRSTPSSAADAEAKAADDAAYGDAGRTVRTAAKREADGNGSMTGAVVRAPAGRARATAPATAGG
jgi:hypothetical protein